MKTKNILIILLFILIIIFSYTMFNKQKSYNKENTAAVEVTSTVTTKLALCSNEYFQTEYATEATFLNDFTSDGKIVIKDFPYREIEDNENCKENEIYDNRISVGGCCPEEGDDNRTKLCYYKNLSLKNVSDLSCVQRIKLSGIESPGVGSYWVNNCFFENDDLTYLSKMINLEEITFDSCGNKNINNNWWGTLKNLKKLKISSSGGDDELFDNILPIVPKIATLKELDLRYSLLSITYYKNYNKLCDWIGNLRDFTINDADRTIYINNKGEFISESIFDKKSKKFYNNCNEWLEAEKKWLRE